MPKPTLTARVAALEKELAEVKSQLAARPKRDLPKIVESMRQSTGMKEVWDEALLIRERDREKTRRANRRTAKPTRAD